MTTCVAFGPDDSWIACFKDSDIAWSNNLPTPIYNKLNGRRNNSQCAPTQVAAMGHGGEYAIFFDNHKWWVNHDSLADDLNKHNIGGCDVKTISFGDDGSYFLLLKNGTTWWQNVNPRLEELIQTKNNASTTWATIGKDSSFFIGFDDGATYWGGGIPDDLRETLQNKMVEKVWLSPFDEDNYFVECSDDTEWNANVGFANSQFSDDRKNSQHVLYTNASISQEFTCGRSIHDVANDLEEGTINEEDIPCMHVFDWNGTTYSLNNRRLWVMSAANISSMPVKYVTPPHSITSKLENGFDGTTIRLR